MIGPWSSPEEMHAHAAEVVSEEPTQEAAVRRLAREVGEVLDADPRLTPGQRRGLLARYERSLAAYMRDLN